MPEAGGTSFKAAELVDLYRHRPPYASNVYQRIIERAPSTKRLVDLGCGEGRIARSMATVFDRVVAVDPSANMIALGRTLENGSAHNLEWVEATAEDAALIGMFDVVTFASSVHWMGPRRLFPKLGKHVGKDHILAIVDGDTAFQPPWQDDWRRFLAKWVPELTGLPLDSGVWHAARTRHPDYVDVVQAEDFVSDPFRQTVENFILCQHSRDTFALPKLGARRWAFHDELESFLRPHADEDGQLTFRVETHLTLATLKACS